MSASPGERTAREFAARRHGALIERETVSTGSGSVAVLNPATEEQLAEVPLADPGTVDLAVAAADAAFRDQRRPPKTRYGSGPCASSASSWRRPWAPWRTTWPGQ